MVDAGSLDRLIAFQTYVVEQDPESGEEGFTLDTTDYIYAQWLPGDTRETYQAQQRLGAYIDGVFRIYDRSPRPDPKLNRILFEGRTFDLKPVIEEGRRESLLVPAVARGEVP